MNTRIRILSTLLVLTALNVAAPVGRATSSYITVPAGGNLQAALDAAQPGDTILLEPGATFVGNFVLRAKSDTATAYITIRSAASDTLLPRPGVRIDPSFAPHLPKLRSPNTAPALATAPWAHHYRLQFLELLANANGSGDIMTLGDGSTNQNSLPMVPHNLIVDRVYIHGDVTLGQKRGIALNSASTSIVNSYISEIKAEGQDSQAIGGWNGPGPFLISNNYLEAAGENVMFGGADPSIVDLVPSDITFTRNHLFKPWSWRGSKWTIKNLLELKSAQRVVIDGNLMENNWLAAQTGYAVLFKSENQDGSAPWTVVQDVQFTNNLVRHVASAINILGKAPAHPAVEASRIVIRNNLFDDVSGARYGGSGRLLMINGGSDITMDHNTAIIDGMSAVYADGNPSARFTFTNNIVQDHAWAIMGSNTGVGNSTIGVYFPNSQFLGGIFIGSNPALYPAANFYPVTVDAVGFVDFAGRDYRLSSTSIYRNGATDGRDPGYDSAALAAALQATPAPVKLLTTSVPNGTVGTPYAQGLAAEGGLGSYTWAVAAGALPAGLSLSHDGIVSGTPASAGTSTFTIVVCDAADTSRSDSRTFTMSIASSTSSTPVVATNIAPTVVMTTASTTVPVDRKVTLSANASDADGTIARVEFSANGTLLGTDSTAPYSMNWMPRTPGDFSITATAVDNGGASTTSAPIVLRVEGTTVRTRK